MNLTFLKKTKVILSVVLSVSIFLPWCNTEVIEMGINGGKYSGPDCYVITTVFGFIGFITSIIIGYMSYKRSRYTWILGLLCLTLGCSYLIFANFYDENIEIHISSNSSYVIHNPDIGLYLFLFTSLVLTILTFKDSLMKSLPINPK